MSLSEYVKREDLVALFHLPMKEASKKLGVSESSLRNICRKHSVDRWPFRKFQQLDAHIESLKNIDYGTQSTEEIMRTREMVSSLLRARQILENSPNMSLELAIIQANKLAEQQQQQQQQQQQMGSPRQQPMASPRGQQQQVSVSPLASPLTSPLTSPRGQVLPNGTILSPRDYANAQQILAAQNAAVHFSNNQSAAAMAQAQLQQQVQQAQAAAAAVSALPIQQPTILQQPATSIISSSSSFFSSVPVGSMTAQQMSTSTNQMQQISPQLQQQLAMYKQQLQQYSLQQQQQQQQQYQQSVEMDNSTSPLQQLVNRAKLQQQQQQQQQFPMTAQNSFPFYQTVQQQQQQKQLL